KLKTDNSKLTTDQGPMTKDNGPSGATLSKTLGKALARLPAALGEIMTLSPIALGIALIALGAWWYEHGAHLRQAGELHELEKQTAGNISQLQAQAAAAVREANQGRARQIVELEMARQKTERDAATLHQRLLALQADQQAQAQKVAALPTPEVARRVAARLGLESRDWGLGTGGSGALTPNPSPASGRGGTGTVGEGSRPPNPEPRAPSPEFLRQVETALVELDGCKQQAQVRDNLL